MKLLHFVSIRSRQMSRMAFFRAKAGQNAGFRVRLKHFEIKKAFRYYIKQIDSMLPCVWFSNRSQKTSKCGKNISDTLGYALYPTFLFLPHFDDICDLLLNRCTTTWNLFIKIEKRVEFWENEKCCGNTSPRRVFPQLFRVLLNFLECFLFLLENTAMRKRKTTC